MAMAESVTEETAIALPKTLLAEMEELALTLAISRDDLVKLAVQRFIRWQQTEQLRAELDGVYTDGPDADEQMVLDAMWEHQRRVILENT